jgi:hypothetical protein
MEAPADRPPEDPEQWTDEQWIEWLNSTDDPGADEGRPVTPMGKVTHSSGGQVLGQAMLGMANAVFGRNDEEVVIVGEAGSDPETDEPFTVHLDPDYPERSSVVVRPPSPPTA